MLFFGLPYKWVEEGEVRNGDWIRWIGALVSLDDPMVWQ